VVKEKKALDRCSFSFVLSGVQREFLLNPQVMSFSGKVSSASPAEQ